VWLAWTTFVLQKSSVRAPPIAIKAFEDIFSNHLLYLRRLQSKVKFMPIESPDQAVGVVHFLTAFFAGSLAILSPCVLPAVPMVATSSLTAHRFGPVGLAAGLMFSFTLVGATLAAFGQSLGISSEGIRSVGAVLIALSGFVLLSQKLQDWISIRFSGLATSADGAASRVSASGLGGQFLIGCLLGAIWSPCTGPLLGAAAGLAATQDTRMLGVFLLMTFSAGSALPLLILSYASQSWMKKNRDKLMRNSSRFKKYIGVALVVVGISIVTHLDRNVETWLLDHLPDAWVEWITKY
jgi:cytochrome c-type biogenesis protein